MKIGAVEEMFVFRVFLDETQYLFHSGGFHFFLVQLSNHKIPQCCFARRTHAQGPPVQEVQADIDDCIQWMRALLVPDKPAGVLPGWPEKPGHVDLFKLNMPGGVFACFPGLDSAKVAKMWDLDSGDLMSALQQHHRGGVASDAGPDFYLGQTSHGYGFMVLLMPSWIAGLALWSDGTVGPEGEHIAGLPLSALRPRTGGLCGSSRCPLRSRTLWHLRSIFSEVGFSLLFFRGEKMRFWR